ncbi:hypothetical protein [Novosphingobium lentum]|uniref:hypothetical protein n=1 Tax=Novosphingobium lentum TaxID=145287 RepID=UPI000833B99B|nr:hypothetical protein [Novosphingobium lentum]
MIKRFGILAARGLALAACASLVSAPALASSIAPITARHVSVAPIAGWNPATERAHEHGGWGRGGRGGGWHGHDDGIDGGDVLAGVLILGGLAAIIAAASSADRKHHDDAPRYRDRPGTGDEASGTVGGAGSGTGGGSDARSADVAAQDRAADACAAQAARRGEVDRIDDVSEADDGLRVTGSLTGGEVFTCSVDRTGAVRQFDWKGSRYGAGGSADSNGQRAAAQAPDFGDSSGT